MGHGGVAANALGPSEWIYRPVGIGSIGRSAWTSLYLLVWSCPYLQCDEPRWMKWRKEIIEWPAIISSSTVAHDRFRLQRAHQIWILDSHGSNQGGWYG